MEQKEHGDEHKKEHTNKETCLLNWSNLRARTGRQLVQCPDCQRSVSTKCLAYSHRCAGDAQEAQRAQESALTAVEKFKQRTQVGKAIAERPAQAIMPQRKYEALLASAFARW